VCPFSFLLNSLSVCAFVICASMFCRTWYVFITLAPCACIHAFWHLSVIFLLHVHSKSIKLNLYSTWCKLTYQHHIFLWEYVLFSLNGFLSVSLSLSLSLSLCVCVCLSLLPSDSQYLNSIDINDIIILCYSDLDFASACLRLCFVFLVCNCTALRLWMDINRSSSGW
jgi:hypothetical protein